MHGFIVAGRHALNSILQVKTLYHTEKQGFGYLGFQKKFQTHPPKPTEAEPSFRKVSLLPLKLRMLFPSHLGVREFWPQICSLWQALDWDLLSKILASTKNGWGLECQKVKSLEYLGQGTLGCHSLSSLAALQVLQQSHKHSHSLQLATTLNYHITTFNKNKNVMRCRDSRSEKSIETK